MDVVVDLLLGREVGSAGRTRGARRDELVVRFQQTCGAVMAKGVEDTAFYRWTHLTGLCEVGGAPEQFALTPTDLSRLGGRSMQVVRPARHDDAVHARHQARRGHPGPARGAQRARRASGRRSSTPCAPRSAPYRSALLDGRTEYLLWQTLAGTWTDDGPIAEDRLVEYLTKAIREAKSRTTWTAPDEPYEGAVLDAARQALVDPTVAELFAGWELRTRPAVRAATLGTKLVQLTLPGIADVYQGTEVPNPVARRPGQPPAGRRWSRWSPAWPGSTTAPVRATSPTRSCWSPRARCGCAGRCRRRSSVPTAGSCRWPTRPGTRSPTPGPSPATPRVAVVATRLAAAVDRLGGWADHTVALPDGDWHDVLTDRPVTGGVVDVGPLLDRLPVALLVRAEG